MNRTLTRSIATGFSNRRRNIDSSNVATTHFAENKVKIFLVGRNFLFIDPTQRTIKPQSKLNLLAIFHTKEDHASIILLYAGNKSGVVETNWLTPHKIRELTVTATGGVAHADYLEQSLEIWEEGAIRAVQIEKREPLKNELELFLHAIAHDKDPSPSGEERKLLHTSSRINRNRIV